MNLPFKLSAIATTDWLQTLSQLNSANAANQLNKVVKQLRLITTDTDEVLKILTQLTPVVIFTTSDIESSLLLKEDNKTSSSSQKIEKLSIQLLRNLSLAFYTFTKDESLAAEAKNQSLFIALQLIGYTQRLTAIFHLTPSSTHWQLTGELYTLAQDRSILYKEIENKLKCFKNQKTIEAIVKRNLLFSILSPYQYTSRKIKQLFSISEQHACLLNLNSDNSADNIFSWDVENIDPPCTINKLHQKNYFTIAINTKPLIETLQSTAFSSQLDKNSLETIIEKLSGFEIINTPLTSALVIKRLFVGFNNITDYLDQVEKLNKIQQLSSNIVNTPNNKKANEVEKDLFPAKPFDSTPVPAQSTSHINLLENAKSVKVLQTKNNQFIIVETHSLSCNIGDITLLCNTNLDHELGIIRQIKITNQSGTLHILIEKTNGTPTCFKIDSPKTPENKVIALQKQGSKPEFFLAPSKLSNGRQIKVNSNESFTLDKLIDYSPFYMRYLTY